MNCSNNRTSTGLTKKTSSEKENAADKKANRSGQEDGAEELELKELPTETKKMKMLAEKVLEAMKEEIDKLEGETLPDKPEENLLGRHGSFYFASFPKEWPGSSILQRIDIETEVGENSNCCAMRVSVSPVTKIFAMCWVNDRKERRQSSQFQRMACA